MILLLFWVIGFVKATLSIYFDYRLIKFKHNRCNACQTNFDTVIDVEKIRKEGAEQERQAWLKEIELLMTVDQARLIEAASSLLRSDQQPATPADWQ